MVRLYVNYTAPINPPSATPYLSQSQIWAALQRKVRRAQDFVPAITSCTVLEEHDNVITRNVVFAPGFMGDAAKTVKEVCVSDEPTRVEFRQEDGTTILNVVGWGPGFGNEGNAEGGLGLYLTYLFEWERADLVRGSDQWEKEMEKYRKVRICICPSPELPSFSHFFTIATKRAI